MRLLFALLIASPAVAQSFDLRDGDSRFAPGALSDRLSGQVLTFYDDGKSEFYADGRYTFTYAEDGGTAYGHWRIAKDGAVCVAFVNGANRCDVFVQNAGRLILLDERGDRFPVRP